MSERILSVLAPIIEYANNKIANFAISASLVVTGQVTKEVAKEPQYISLADIGVMGISLASWLQIIGGIWIILQILNFCGFFRAISLLIRFIQERKIP